MKYRIIECTEGNETWYEVQKKGFLFWRTLQYPEGRGTYRFDTTAAARRFIDREKKRAILVKRTVFEKL